MTDRRAHWLRPNEANRYPRRLICLDAEARIAYEPPRERHTFRLACASFDTIERATRTPAQSRFAAYLDPLELWRELDAFTRSKERTALFAHNLAYDLRLTRAFELLPALGWELSTCSLDSYRCWARWRREQRTLLMVDTMSFVGRGLAKVAAELGRAKPELPRQSDPERVWLERCRADTETLRELVLRLLRWLEENECGNFRMTGPAQASAAFRHRHLNGYRLLVHDSPETLAAERRSAWTGRCEVWRHGDVEEPLVEWDYALAYARIARDAELPVRLRGEAEGLSLERLRALSRRFAVLAELTVETETPCLPTEHEERILWPVGRFETIAWDCEIELALQAGARLTPGRAWLYRRGPLLQAWATWILAELEGANRQACPVVRTLLKGWSRSLIGRFGLRYPRWEKAGYAAEPDVCLLPYIEAGSEERGVFLRLGHQVLEQAGLEESPDSAPAVMAYVMALARCRLWAAMQAAGAAELVYVDTDSLIVSATGSRRLEAFARTPLGEGLRVKARYRRGAFIAPRQIELGGEARMAGVPKTARRVGRRVYRGEVWESASESLRQRHPGEVVVSEHLIRLRGHDYRRKHLDGHRTAPYALRGPAATDPPREDARRLESLTARSRGV